MGSIQSRQQLPNKKKFIILDYGYCIVWKKKQDSFEFMEEYQICIESQQRRKAFQTVWPLRTNSSIFVNVYYFSHTNSSSFCGQIAQGSIFTERIPYRLSQFSSIPYTQTLRILKKCIEGYGILHQNFGLFLARSTMIGFTSSYNVKIWFHTDFSQPQPQNANCKSLNQMMISIIRSIQSASQCSYFQYPKFSQFIVRTNYTYLAKDFKLLLKGFQQYMKKFNIFVGQKLGSLHNYLKKPEGWEKFKANTIYPKLITSQTQINERDDSLLIKQDLFNKKRQSSSKIDQLNSTVKKGWNTQNYYNETNNRMSQRLSIQKTQQFSLQNKNLPAYNIKNKLTNNDTNNVYLKKSFQPPSVNQNIKFCRSTQKLQQKNSFFPNNFTNKQSNLQRFHSPPSYVFKQPLHDYYGQTLPNLKLLKNKNASQTHNENKINSFDVSTATRNRDKSMDSTISLIEDLEIKGSGKKNFVRLIGYK